MPKPARAAAAADDLVSVIIVNFNAGGYLRAAIDSVRSQDGGAIEIIVVDNHSTDGSLDWLGDDPAPAPPVRLIRLERNLGFARACNIGLGAALGRSLLFLNPDCRLFPGGLAALRAALDADQRIGMVGPRVINPDGSEQRGGRRDVPTPWQIFCEVLRLHRLMPNHPRFRSFNRHDEPLPDHPVPVPAVSGACMLVRRAAISGVGMMDPEYPMHFEDLDWCLRFEEAGWRVVFVPAAVAEHTRGVCSASAPLRAEYYKHRGLVRFLRKHFTPYYPTSFMAVVIGLVTLRFALLVPRLLFARRVGPPRPALLPGAEHGARQS